jgi:transcriptional regulator with XRE-family HTH domain
MRQRRSRLNERIDAPRGGGSPTDPRPPAGKDIHGRRIERGPIVSAGDERVPRYDRALFARRLQAAIDRLGLTYEETARRAREHLPPDARLSSVSVWQYAKGKTFPRRMSYVEALSRVLDVTPNHLLLPASAEGAGAGTGEDAIIRPGPSEPHIRLEDLGGGRARLDLTLDLPWPVALQILQLAKGSQSPEGIEGT